MAIDDLSTEILQKIYEYATVHDVLRFARASKKNFNAYMGRRLPILKRAIHNSYSPLPDLIRLVISDEPEQSRKLLGTEIRLHARLNRMVQIRDDTSITLGMIIKMIQYGRVAERWMEIFPQLRWRFGYNNRRLLNPHEQERLRAAIYRYWTYNNLFHSQSFIQYNSHNPYRRDDIRTRLLRTYSTIDLIQLSEFLAHVAQLLGDIIHPSYSTLRKSFPDLPEQTMCKIAWGAGDGHLHLVDDLLKYNPRDVLYLFENTSHKRERLEYLHAQGEYFLNAPSTLNAALLMVTKTRMSLRDQRRWFRSTCLPVSFLDAEDENVRLGIVDVDSDVWTDGCEYQRERCEWAGDGMPDGLFCDTEGAVSLYTSALTELQDEEGD